MPKNRALLAAGAVVVAVSIPLWAYAGYLAVKGDLDLSVLAALPGLALILFLPLALPADLRIEIWQGIVFRFVTWGFGATLLALAFDVPPIPSMVIGLVAGSLWAAWWFVGRPGEVPED